ncbi:DUF2125 domain-containing protein [Paracoccus caeni]|uniref:DUF2125 domain-containing protein n=1 Tax=Paracoccus caeni TaxID=657651 RepID=A0A934VXT5_9RHOB|nr:DUF2125 domain-containing protein [Paracoccus caeni]MBK4215297.1 DUF2125 domain-containing protein [Paracoccus caeni]
MKRRALLMIPVLLVGGWLLAEPLLVRQARVQIAEIAELSVTGIKAQPGTDRLGLYLEGIAWDDGLRFLDMPALDLWVTPLTPTTIRATLPDTVTYGDRMGATNLAATEGRASLRLWPFGGEVSFAAVDVGSLSLDGQPLTGKGNVSARLANIGDGPGQAVSSYDLDLAVSQPGDAGPLLQGKAQVWLDGKLDAAAASQAVPPRVLGVSTEGMEIGGAGFAGRIAGRVTADAEGLAEGQVAIYSRDAAPLIDAAIDAGILSQNIRVLANTMLNRIGHMDFASGADTGFPAAAEGELRLPVEFRDGRMFLGTIEVGPAFRLADPAS